MKRRIAGTVSLVALFVGVAAMVSAQNPHPCSNDDAAGTWGYTKTGTLYLPTGATPFATMGTFTLGADGTLSGVNNGSVGGGVSKDVLKGTFSVDPDCMGTMAVEVYNQAGALLRTIGMAIVVDDGGKHLRGIMTSLTLPNGANVLSVVTADAKRVFGGRSEAQ